ncbi:MAG: hypothetical protein HY513_04250 [Candidatus Aenigmarchaeota archaeon]|nr:hypothetical protein [Candidatus Aenigmarchaeota archaeon]
MTEETFEAYAYNAMDAIVKRHEHPHPYYDPTEISDWRIDETSKRAAFVLAEQIDTDRSENGIGWLGDEFRVSLWYLESYQEPRMLYKDEAWAKFYPDSFNLISGRVPSIELVSVETDGIVIKAYSEKEQKKKEMKIGFDGTVEKYMGE